MTKHPTTRKPPTIWHKAAQLVFGSTMLIMTMTGCGAKSVESPLMGEKIYSPDNTGPTLSTEMASAPKEAEKKHEYTDDERKALEDNDPYALQYRPFRLNGKIYEENGEGFVEGAYLPRNGSVGVHVVFYFPPVPERLVAMGQAKRLICGKKACGAVEIDQAHKMSKEIQDLWIKKQKLEAERRNTKTTDKIYSTVKKKVSKTVEEIKTGEDALKAMGRNLPSRLEHANMQ